MHLAQQMQVCIRLRVVQIESLPPKGNTVLQASCGQTSHIARLCLASEAADECLTWVGACLHRFVAPIDPLPLHKGRDFVGHSEMVGGACDEPELVLAGGAKLLPCRPSSHYRWVEELERRRAQLL